MSLKTWFLRWIRLGRKLTERINSFSQLIMLLRILFWWGLLRLLQPIFSVRQIVKLATYRNSQGKFSSSDVLPCLRLFYDISLWIQGGDCLPRALVSHRFLKLAGFDSKVVIGFNGEMGHSWVDLGGKPFLETEAQVMQYQPALILRPEDKTLMKAKPNERNVSL